MALTLHYVFELYGEVNDDGSNNPDTHYGTFEQDYDYEVPVFDKVIKDYLIDTIIGKETYRGWTKEKQLGFERALEILYQEEMFNEDYFETNKDFEEWAQQYFEEEAHKQAQQDYGD